ncbi:SH2 domain containing protein, partial [Asbolus verrucosus]
YHWCLHKEHKRYSVAGTSAPMEGEPIHMTLQEVRHYLQILYSSSSDSSDHKERNSKPKPSLIVTTENKYTTERNNALAHKEVNCVTNANGRTKKSTFLINVNNKKVKDSCDNITKPDKRKKAPAKFSFKQTVGNIFRFKRFLSPEHVKCDVSVVQEESNYINNTNSVEETRSNISCRALPPLPPKEEEETLEEQTLDFATSIQRVKDYGWYWGPLPTEVAEKILSNEPDGSFIVRDSSDDHYIFSLTFKLNNCVRHVRIDHDQGILYTIYSESECCNFEFFFR